MIKKTLLCVILVWLVFLANACCCVMKQTQFFDSKKRTAELLNIHSSICPEVPFNMNESKIVFFSDLHRGMGEKDVFKNNKELFKKVLDYYNKEKFTLVFIGDVEEGWGFQSSNIPLILNWHKDEFDLEKEFNKDQRLYRIYGNHDDYYRGNCLCSDCLGFSKVYPAVIFKDKDHNFNMFITHSCQGHGLHDAGDELASWGVYVKYNWLTEIFPKKFKSHRHLVHEMDKINRQLQKHEKCVYDWTYQQKNGRGENKFNIFIAGHTHIPVFKSDPLDQIKDKIADELNDVKGKEYIFFNDIFENNEDESNGKDGNEVPEKLKHAMIKSMQKYDMNALYAKKPDQDRSPHDYFYFNTGCAFLSEIPCIEIKDGKIQLKFITGFNEETKQPEYDVNNQYSENLTYYLEN
ncbi:MAG TPA: metallophosphoesterase [Candidatus Deferrimicrobium sp.]|nr:metallophosphoesterase [Candidatus Deferrimicrobium sp.]